MLDFDGIADLFARRGHEQYAGEPVTQLEHALQTAALAEAEGASDALVTAALLHDLGHLVHDLGATPTLQGVDDQHQYRALGPLRGLFDARVLDPIKLHVDAKRYLCAIDDGYRATLSDDSMRSLALQGGAFTGDEASAFLALPGATEALRLRRWDDQAKIAGRVTPPLEHFLERARNVALVCPE
ncbi:MAG: phosphohydrolase [Burkholderiales bacterium]|nr:phosphohydrolase [Burkholderiales bacterium]